MRRVSQRTWYYVTGGKAWMAHGISTEQVRALNLPALNGAPALQAYCETLIEDAGRLGFLRVESAETQDNA